MAVVMAVNIPASPDWEGSTIRPLDWTHTLGTALLLMDGETYVMTDGQWVQVESAPIYDRLVDEFWGYVGWDEDDDA